MVAFGIAYWLDMSLGPAGYCYMAWWKDRSKVNWTTPARGSYAVLLNQHCDVHFSRTVQKQLHIPKIHRDPSFGKKDSLQSSPLSQRVFGLQRQWCRRYDRDPKTSRLPQLPQVVSLAAGRPLLEEALSSEGRLSCCLRYLRRMGAAHLCTAPVLL